MSEISWQEDTGEHVAMVEILAARIAELEIQRAYGIAAYHGWARIAEGMDVELSQIRTEGKVSASRG